jgi:uncharacterized RDD family membrane protein YckC
MDWFYAQNNRQIGPVALDALLSLLQRRQIQPQDLVWREGMADWQPAATVPELAAAVSVPGGAVEYFNPLGPSLEAPVFAGFWLRFAAIVIDYFVLYTLYYLLGTMLAIQTPMLMHHHRSPFLMLFMFGGEAFFMELAIAWLYYALMETSRYQATLGKIAVGVIVTDLNGNRIGFGRATARFFAKILSFHPTLFIGCMMAGWTSKKQALHDIIAGCLVIRRRPTF